MTMTEPDFQSILDASKETPQGATVTPEVTDGVPKFEANVDLGKADIYDDSAEVAAKMQRDRELGVETQEYPEPTLTPIVNSHVMVDAVTGGLFGEDSKGDKVEITPEEAKRFLRCALHDEEMYFDVQPIVGEDITIRVAQPTEMFITLASSMINTWDFVSNNSTMQWILSMQQAHVWFCIRNINGVPTVWSDRFADGVPKMSELIGILRKPEDEMSCVFNMNAARWSMCMEALRISEVKLKICLSAWRKRDFFGSGDTAQ